MKLFSKTQTPQSTLLAIVETEDAARCIRQACSQLPDLKSTVKTADDAIADAGRLVNGSADVVIVECDATDARASAVLQRLSGYVGVTGHMLVVARNADAGHVRDFFRLGASDVLTPPLAPPDLAGAIASALQAPRSRQRGSLGRVVSLLKCGGGAGATTLAVNLAHNIASRRKVVSGKAPNALVIDLDLQFGAVASVVGANQVVTVMDLLRKGADFDHSHLETAVQSLGPNLDILASPSEIVPMSALTGDFLQSLMAAARERYDYVIVDHAHTWSSATAHALRMSDVVLMVGLPSVEHAKGATTILNGLDEIEVGRESVLMVHSQVKGVAHRERVATMDRLTQRPSVQVPYDEKAHGLARNQAKLLHEVSGSKSQIKAVTRLTDRVFEMLNTPVGIAAADRSDAGRVEQAGV